MQDEVKEITGFIPEPVIEEVKAQNELVSVVEQYVRLDKRSSSNYFGLCPFHAEKTPSFSVSPSKQIYYCFGCHKGGDVIHFIMDIEKMSYPEAIRYLAERAGIQIPEPDDARWQEKQAQKKRLQTIYLEAARHYYRNLTGLSGERARAYLNRRSLSPATCKRFGLGYALDEWDGLLRHLNSLGYENTEELLQSGLFKSGKNNHLYDLFRNRLMFPIFDAMGRIIAFGGRVLDDSLPKYINSPETALYSKGRHLYAFNLAKNSKQDQLVVVEGYMDAIALHQAGFQQVVASLGTALTDSQAQLLRKYTEHVMIAYDADAAGQAATLRSLDILSKKGLKVTVLQVPDGQDPDSYIQNHGPERFHALMDRALPLLDYKLFSAQRESTVQGKLDPLLFQDKACSILAAQDNAIVRELYANNVAETLQASPEAVLAEIERRRGRPDGDSNKKPHKAEQQDKEPDRAKPGEMATREEIYLMGLIAAEPSLIQTVGITVDDFSEGLMQDLAAELIKKANEGTLTPSFLFDLCEGKTVRQRPLHDLMARVCMRLEDLFGQQDLAMAAAEQLWKQRIKRLRCRLDEIRCDLGGPCDPKQQADLKKELLTVTTRLTQLKQQANQRPEQKANHEHNEQEEQFNGYKE